MKYFVTGGAGFIGSHLVDLLLKNEYEVTIFDNLSNCSEEQAKSLSKKGAVFVKGDITNKDEVENSIEISKQFKHAI